MKHIIRFMAIILFSGVYILGAENKIAPCDEIVINTFGEIITLSKDRSELQRYKNNILINSFKNDGLGSKTSLEDPLKPVYEAPDKIHILDMGSRSIITWNRFLDLHAISPLPENIISPSAFVVSSEHDWLIFDDDSEQILQIHPGEVYTQIWGSEQYSPEIELFSIQERILIHQKDKMELTIADENGNTLSSYYLPDSLKNTKLFPLNLKEIAISSDQGQFLWKPQTDLLRYLSNKNNVIFIDQHAQSGIRMITRDGVISYLP